jgi:hypothetical protein
MAEGNNILAGFNLSVQTNAILRQFVASQQLAHPLHIQVVITGRSTEELIQ